MTEHPGIAEINRQLDRLDDARLIGRGVTAITSWPLAHDAATMDQPDLGAIRIAIEVSADPALRYQEPGSTPVTDPDRYEPPSRDTLRAWAKGIAQIEARLEGIAGVFSKPDKIQSLWQRGGRRFTDPPGTEEDELNRTRDLQTRVRVEQRLDAITAEGDVDVRRGHLTALGREARRFAPGERGLGSIPYASAWHLPTVCDVYTHIDHLLTEDRKAGNRLPESLEVRDPDGVRCPVGIREVHEPVSGQMAPITPSEAACRLIGTRQGCGWKSVRDNVTLLA